MILILATLLTLGTAELTGTIEDIEHIVIFMQENRPYDHYYGTLKGGRGFSDRASPMLPNGKPVWYQPVVKDGEEVNEDEADYLLPFPTPFDKTSSTCMSAPTMSFPCDTLILNGGKMNGWNTARDPGFGMAYFDRDDLPFYYSLADSFTFADQYFQSTFTCTCPNREHLFTGSNGCSVGEGEYCMMDNTEPSKGFPWETMGETLLNANVSWKLFQEMDNFDDNGFAWFSSFKNSQPGDPLYDQGMHRGEDFVADFEDAVVNDALPQVTWLVGPAALSEHAENHPADGEDLSARLLKIVGDPKNAKVFAKTAFILNYDEGGQFFDHHWPPVPANSADDGVSTVTTKGEITTYEILGVPKGHPIGLGFRVPMFVISPWSRGGVVNSEVMDHTSVIKFIEKRFGVKCPNISPWRRSLVGDLTSAFNFTHPDFSPWPVLPDTSANVNTSKKECDTLPPPTIPATQAMPSQEPGIRRSNALPYDLKVDAVAESSMLTLLFTNAGEAGAHFMMYDRVTPTNTPQKYTVEAGKTLKASVNFPSGKWGYSVHGPNGFVRQFGGDSTATTGQVQAMYDTKNGNVVISMKAMSKDGATFTITDNAYGQPSATVHATETATTHSVTVSSSGNWYDLSVQAGSDVWRFMGRMENGLELTTDPAVASGKAHTSMPAAGFPVGLEGFASAYDSHLPVAEWYRTGPIPWNKHDNCQTERQRYMNKDACMTHAVAFLQDEL